MGQQTRFCTAADGARIAYATMGDGPPLIVTPSSWDSISPGPEDAAKDPYYQALAQRHLVVRYDRRGVGLSDRERTDYTVEAEARDLAAVVDAARLETFALLASFHLGPAAIAYAVAHPERVSRLILYATFARGQDLTRDEVKASIIGMVRSHWGMASRTLADIVAPGVEGRALEEIARNERDSVSGETVVKFLEMAYATDVTELLPGIQAPTQVLHRRGDRAVPFRMARELAALLPNARLVALEGNIHFPWFGDTDAILKAILEFLEEDRPAQRESVEMAGDVHTILFTDMESSTALTQRLGDAKAQEVRRTHNAIVREALRAHGGSEIKHTGDGIMASFTTPSTALECAIAVQQGVASHRLEHPDTPLGVYVGLNAGEPIAEDHDLFGTSVDLAKRICDHAEPGQILVPIVVRELAAGKGFLFADIGETELRGFEDPVRLYEVRWQEEG